MLLLLLLLSYQSSCCVFRSFTFYNHVLKSCVVVTSYPYLHYFMKLFISLFLSISFQHNHCDSPHVGQFLITIEGQGPTPSQAERHVKCDNVGKLTVGDFYFGQHL